MELNATQRHLLLILADAEDGGLGAEEASRQMQAVMPKRFGPWRGPWFGLEADADSLEDLGLIVTDFGIASCHAPDEPAPSEHDVFLQITDAGREAAAALRRTEP